MEPAFQPNTVFHIEHRSNYHEALDSAFNVVTKSNPHLEAELNRFYDLAKVRRFADVVASEHRRMLYAAPLREGEYRDDNLINKAATAFSDAMVTDRLEILTVMIKGRISAIDEWVAEAKTLYEAPELSIADGTVTNFGKATISVKQQLRYVAGLRFGFEENVEYLDMVHGMMKEGLAPWLQLAERSEKENEGVKVETDEVVV